MEPIKNMELEILKRAEEVFLERGYAMTSTVEIARRAGCNQTLVHYYFRSKENLFQATFAHKFLTFIRSLVDFEEQELPFESIVARIVESHFDIFMADQRLPYLFIDELLRNLARLTAIEKMIMDNIPMEAIKRFEIRLNKEIAAGKIRQMTILDLSMTIFSINMMPFIISPIIMGVLHQSTEEHTRFLSHRRQENIEVVLRSLRP